MTAQLSQKNILLVEDNADSREMLALILQGEGYNVWEAGNGQEALEMLERLPRPCIILLDLMMPVMDGWEFRLRQQQDPRLSSIPVVVVSAVHDADAHAALAATRWLKKPLDIGVLLQTVGVHC
jgi:CheY-like chemotaxis protein